MSDFCFEEEACHASPTIGDGASEVVVSVCSIVNIGESAAIRIDPLLYLHWPFQQQYFIQLEIEIYPKANALQSAVGAMVHSGSNIVLAVIDSPRAGSKRMMFPRASPENVNN
jgi:hypothetical protein